jgi:hypothetical protein
MTVDVMKQLAGHFSALGPSRPASRPTGEKPIKKALTVMRLRRLALVALSPSMMASPHESMPARPARPAWVGVGR